MCLSRLGQIIYGVLAFAAVALIAASMFTPAWQKLDVDAGSLFKGDWKKVKFGLFACQFPNNTGAGQATTTTSTTNFAATSTITSTSNSTSRGGSAQKTGENSQSSNSFDEELEFCKIWFDHLPTHKKVVIVAMILALGTSLLAFVWNILSFCACFCKGHAMKPLPFLAGLTTLLLITALAIFYYTYQTDIEQLRKNAQQKVLPDQSDKNDVVETIEKIWNLTKELKDGGNQVSYSFWLACGAVVASFANLIVGSLIVCLADKCL